ncbi:MAG: ABC transporter substrate-binding protein [Alphaproteobacteria bacterium]|nr:ABC transporter substrate-binding protein [Alphaproteobacteria bacterium]TAD89835.1 MAG: ABC transporter substrate-binding protein [Alphaproteobacteria bacterium]
MLRRTVTTGLAAAALAAPLVLGALPAAAQQTTLRVFIGGQQRPDVMRPLMDLFQQQNPGVRVEIEVGGATSEAQQQYLTTVLTSRDPAIDVMLIDVVRPAQFAAAGWAEPLDAYLGGTDRATVLRRYLPGYAEAVVVDNKLMSLPAFADAMFLYYRTDLLQKYGLQPPRTWEETVSHARRIMAGENNPNLQGLNFQGAPIEGTNCTFLIPFWQLGGNLVGANNRVTVNNDAGRGAFQFWLDAMRTHRVSPANSAEVRTDDTRLQFQNGNVAFAVLWAYGWNLFQSEQSQVRGKVGVVPLPTFQGRQSATCIGGWQWAVSAFSRNKPDAAKLVQFLASGVASKHLAINASNLPVLPDLYRDPDVLRTNPWFEAALPVVITARSRPVSPRYPEVSEIIRTNVNGVIAGTKTPQAALTEMESRLQRVLR